MTESMQKALMSDAWTRINYEVDYNILLALSFAALPFPNEIHQPNQFHRWNSSTPYDVQKRPPTSFPLWETWQKICAPQMRASFAQTCSVACQSPPAVVVAWGPDYWHECWVLPYCVFFQAVDQRYFHQKQWLLIGVSNWSPHASLVERGFAVEQCMG